MLIGKYLLNRLSVALTAILLFTSPLTLAQEMTVEHYVLMDLQARQVTVKGIQQRLILLQSNTGLDKQLEQDAETQQEVEAVYQQNNMTPSSAIAWATHNRQAITRWLTDNLEQQAEYDRIAFELNAVSNQIQSLANQ